MFKRSSRYLEVESKAGDFVLLVVPGRCFCGGSFCFVSWCLKFLCCWRLVCVFMFLVMFG